MTRKQAESYGYSIVRSGWDNTWIIIPPEGLYEDQGGYRTVREALEHIEQSMEVA